MASDAYELSFWGDCANSFHEEQKQLVCAARMGLLANWNVAHPPTFDLQGRSVIDIGGGPVSLLLKCENFTRAVVADPCPYPGWVIDRYKLHGVEYWMMAGEDIDGYSFDEAWIYNVLQHVQSPKRLIARARAAARVIRLFEWIGFDPYPGHPHRLERESLDEWLEGVGFTTNLNENGAVGEAYYGVFRGI